MEPESGSTRLADARIQVLYALDVNRLALGVRRREHSAPSALGEIVARGETALEDFGELAGAARRERIYAACERKW